MPGTARVSPRLLLLAAFFALVAAGPVQKLEIPAYPVPGTRPPPGPLPATIASPDGAGRFPVVILLHGCGGLGNGRQMRSWADRVIGWGYAAVIPDSLTPRGVPSVCAPAHQVLVTAADRAGDVLNTALYLRTLPTIDPNRIGVIGFSHGGGTAATVTRRDFQNLHPGLLRAVVDYYGACRQPDRHGTVPLLVFAGLDDTWGNPARLCTSFGADLGASQPFQLITYPDTVHAFDNAALRARRYEEGHPLQYNSGPANDSFTRVHAFLDQWMRP